MQVVYLEPVPDDVAAIQRAFVSLLDSEHRVVLEVVPEKWITFDVSKMRADTAMAMAKAAMPEGVVRMAGALRRIWP